MKFIPILFSTKMVQAILEGRKVQTRRVVKPQPNIDQQTGDYLYKGFEGSEEVSPIEDWSKIRATQCPYGQPGDVLFICMDIREADIFVIFTSIKEFTYGKFDFKTNSDLSEQQLHGWERWEDLLKNEIQRLWKEGFSGLVSFSWAQDNKGLLRCFLVPRWEKNYESRTQAHLSCISWDTKSREYASKTFGWEQGEQSTGELSMGNTSRKLARQKTTRERNEWGNAPNEQADEQRKRAYQMGGIKWNSITKAYCKNIGDVTISYTTNLPIEPTVLWVRETWAEYYDPHGHPYQPLFSYKANNNSTPAKWKPSIFMPKAACRLFLRVKSVRVERLQDISSEDIKAEGVSWTIDYLPNLMELWQNLWIKVNGSESWEANPFVWVVEFERIEKPEGFC